LVLFAAVSRSPRPDRKVVFAVYPADALSADGASLFQAIMERLLFFVISDMI